VRRQVLRLLRLDHVRDRLGAAHVERLVRVDRDQDRPDGGVDVVALVALAQVVEHAGLVHVVQQHHVLDDELLVLAGHGHQLCELLVAHHQVELEARGRVEPLHVDAAAEALVDRREHPRVLIVDRAPAGRAGGVSTRALLAAVGVVASWVCVCGWDDRPRVAPRGTTRAHQTR